MYTSKVIKLHEKALSILEMITKVNNRLESTRSNLAFYDSLPWYSAEPIRLMVTREDIVSQQEKNRAIKARLVLYYANTMEQLIVPALHAVESLNVDLIKVNQLKAAI